MPSEPSNDGSRVVAADRRLAQTSTAADGGRAAILTYHRIADDSCDPWALCVTPDRFDQQMASLGQLVDVVPLMTLADDVRRGHLGAHRIALTFDDGYNDNARIARSILERHGLAATYFLVSGMIGTDREFWWDELDRVLLAPGQLPHRFDTDVAGTRIHEDLKEAVVYTPREADRDRAWRAWDPPPTGRHRLYTRLWKALRPLAHAEQQHALDTLRDWASLPPGGRPRRLAVSAADLTALAGHRLIDVGCHTDTHPQLSSLPLARQAAEIQRCRGDLERLLGRPVTACAYPFGAYRDYGADTRAVVEDLGFRAACTTLQSFLVTGVDPLQLPRFTVMDWSGDEFAQRLRAWIGHPVQPRRRTGPRVTLRPDDALAGRPGAARDDAAITGADLADRPLPPLVSVVTAFRDAEQFIEEAIHSVLAQTYQTWELLLIDDGSQDGSSALARHYASTYPDRIRYVEHEGHANIGAAASRNVGVRAARGAYVAVLDADDVWLPHKLAEQVAILEAEADIAMVCSASLHWCGWTGRPEDRHRDVVKPLGVATNQRYEPQRLLSELYPLGAGGAPCPSNVLLRRSVLEPAGGFEEQFLGPYQLYEDQAFLAKLYLRHRVLVADALWDKYRIHPGSCVSSVMAAGKYRQVRKFFLDWFQQHLSRCDGVDADVWAVLHRALADYSPPLTIAGPVPLGPADWTLRTDNGSVATLKRGHDPELIQVEMDSPPAALPWDVQINHARLEIVATSRYVVRCQVRAATSRTIRVGVAMAVEPWENLGLYSTIEVAADWVDVCEEFTATHGAPDGRVHIDMGGASSAVEIRAVTISPA